MNGGAGRGNSERCEGRVIGEEATSLAPDKDRGAERGDGGGQVLAVLAVNTGKFTLPVS